MPFNGGGRVVKNVAGYDFCKLLTGSLGTLGVITQVTLKVKPLPEASAFVACDVADFDHGRTAAWPRWSRRRRRPRPSSCWPARRGTTIAALGPAPPERSPGWPSAWKARGRKSIGWSSSLRASGASWASQHCAAIIRQADVNGLWQRLTEFPAVGRRAAGRQGQRAAQPACASFAAACWKSIRRLLDPGPRRQRHRRRAVRTVRRRPTLRGCSIGGLQPAAIACGGHAVVLSCGQAAELTRQAVWGGATDDVRVMQAVQRAVRPTRHLEPRAV